MPDSPLKAAMSHRMEQKVLANGTSDTSADSVSFLNYVFNENIASQLGEGTFAIVYKGVNKVTGQGVAIKKAKKDRCKASEIDLVRSLDSDYMVRLLAVHESVLDIYMAMELCDTDLSKHLADGQPLSAPNFNVVLDNLAHGYNELYRQRIVHRDIKPENLLLIYAPTTDRKLIASVKITDFGMSRIWDDGEDEADTGMSNVAGSFLYMAPEVGANMIRDKDYGWKVDIWSIGCVLFQCASGQVPFNEQSLCKLFLKVASENYSGYRKPALAIDSPYAPLQPLLDQLLEIDADRRISPQQLYEAAIDWTTTGSFTLPSKKSAEPEL